MKLIGEYKNGNYSVQIFNDGTKIRATEEDRFIPAFSESIDVKITNRCDMQCPFCHENSTPKGAHGNILQYDFINSIHPYTEIAIGGGNPLSHPDLIHFLDLLKDKNVIANITVNQTHFMEQYDLVKYLYDNKLVYGIGVSFTEYSEDFLNKVHSMDNVVLHVINGIVTLEQLEKLYDKKLKVLILGYKKIRRGLSYFSENVVKNQQDIYDNIKEIVTKFDVTSFDNLAIKQFQLKRIMDEDKWNEFYMGNDGQYTFYVDLVNEQFAKSSCEETRYPLMQNIDTMFDMVRDFAI